MELNSSVTTRLSDSSRKKSKITMNTIIHGDCLKIMKNIPSSMKFDVIIADPPYNIGKNFENNVCSKSIDEYVSWCQDWIKQCFRF